MTDVESQAKQQNHISKQDLNKAMNLTFSVQKLIIILHCHYWKSTGTAYNRLMNIYLEMETPILF